MRWWPVCLVLIACEAPPPPRYPGPPITSAPGAPAFEPVQITEPDDDPDPQPPPRPTPAGLVNAAPARPLDAPALDPIGTLVQRSSEFVFDGGSVELVLTRDGDHVMQWAVNHYAVPIVIHWEVSKLKNLGALTPTDGVILLPPAPAPLGDSAPVSLAELAIVDPQAAYHRDINFTARFGNPRVRASRYAYRLPYPSGHAFNVLQGFHGAFSHRGSDEYAVDFDCPVATPVIAARPGVVVATHASAQGAGTTPEYLDYKRANFVLVLHDDGTLGEYMHLAPAGVEVMPGQTVKRGQELALSGNTGFSSTPHLHFQVMTAATDGVMAHSFPFSFAIGDNDVEQPVEGHRYPAWE